MYPVVPHPEQDQTARSKLAELEKKSGTKPNILIFIMDDVGWMDPGFNGGGVAIGNDTPTMDRLAGEGLLLTSGYSTRSTPRTTRSRLTRDCLLAGMLSHGAFLRRPSCKTARKEWSTFRTNAPFLFSTRVWTLPRRKDDGSTSQ